MFNIPFPSFDITSLLSSLLSGLGNLFINLLNWLWMQAVGVIEWIIQLIPQSPLWPSAISYSSAWSYVLNNLAYELNTWNYYIAFNLWLYLAGLALSAEAVASAWKGIRWLISHLPFVGGEG